MKLVNSNTAMFAGFFISFVAIVVNALVLASVNNHIGAVDAEVARLNEALRSQTANGNEAETKFQSYRIMHHLASLVAAANRADADGDATALLNEALTFLFAAANEVSAKESGEKPIAEQTPKDDEKQEAEKALEAALRELEMAGAAGDGDLQKKVAAISTISVAAAAAENENEFFVRIFPVNKALSARWVESVKQKQARLVELEADKRQLIKYQGYSTFAALALQMLGLTFVILKDVLKMKESGD